MKLYFLQIAWFDTKKNTNSFEKFEFGGNKKIYFGKYTSISKNLEIDEEYCKEICNPFKFNIKAQVSINICKWYRILASNMKVSFGKF